MSDERVAESCLYGTTRFSIGQQYLMTQPMISNHQLFARTHFEYKEIDLQAIGKHERRVKLSRRF